MHAHRPRYWHENMVVQGDNEGMCCQSPPPISGAWEGKQRIDLKDLKGGRSPPQKEQKQCQEMLAPVFLSLPPLFLLPLVSIDALSPHPLCSAQYETSPTLTQNLEPSTAAPPFCFGWCQV